MICDGQGAVLKGKIKYTNLLCFIKSVQAELFHTEIDDGGDDGEVDEVEYQVAVHDLGVEYAHIRSGQVLRPTEYDAEQGIDEILHHGCHEGRDGPAQYESYRQADDALGAYEFEESRELLFHVCALCAVPRSSVPRDSMHVRVF